MRCAPGLSLRMNYQPAEKVPSGLFQSADALQWAGSYALDLCPPPRADGKSKAGARPLVCDRKAPHLWSAGRNPDAMLLANANARGCSIVRGYSSPPDFPESRWRSSCQTGIDSAGHRGLLWLQVLLRNFTLQPIGPMATSPIPSRLEESPPAWTTPEFTPPPWTLPGKPAPAPRCPKSCGRLHNLAEETSGLFGRKRWTVTNPLVLMSLRR